MRRTRPGSALSPSPIWLAALVAIVALLGVHAGHHWSFTVDDAGISFAYAKNLAEGCGLVLTPGAERVEAATNLLWCLLLVPASWLHVPHALWAKILGVSFAAFATIGVALFPAVAYRRRPRLFDLVAPLILVAMPHFVVWSVSGLENGLFSALTAATLVTLAWEEHDARRFPWSALLVALVFATRPDGLLYVLVVGIAKLARVAARRGRRADLKWLALLVAVIGSIEIFRLAYFAWPMPNSFYAKKRVFSFGEALLDWKKGRGWGYVRGWFEDYKLTGLAPLVPLMLLGLRAPIARLALFGFVCAGVLFPVYSNGDWMEEYRFLTFLAPSLALAIGEAARAAARLALVPTRIRLRWPFAPAIRRPLALAAALACGLFALSRGLRHYPDRAKKALGHDTLPIEQVSARAHYYLNAAQALGLPPEPSVLDPDVGGLSFDGRLRVIDLFGLGDLPITRTHPFDPPGSREAVFWERRPTFFHLHGAWFHDMELERLEEVQGGYVLLPQTIGGEYEQGTNYVRREALAAPWALPQVSWSVRGGAGASIDGATISAASVDPGRRLVVELYVARANAGGAESVVAWRDGAPCCEQELPAVVAGGLITAGFLDGERPRARVDLRLPPGRHHVGLRRRSGEIAEIGTVQVGAGGSILERFAIQNDARALIAARDLAGAERLAARALLRLTLDPRDAGALGALDVIARDLAATARALAKGGAVRTAALLARRASAWSKDGQVRDAAADVAARVDAESRAVLGDDATAGVELAREAVLTDPSRSWSRRRVEEHRAQAFLSYDGGRDQAAYRLAASALTGSASLDRAIVFLGGSERWIEASALQERDGREVVEPDAKVVVARGLVSRGRAAEALALVRDVPCDVAHDPELTRALAALLGKPYRDEPSCSAPPPAPPAPFDRAVGSFESGAYRGWTRIGPAFGTIASFMPAPGQQFVNGYAGRRYASSFGIGGDLGRGALRSAPFTIRSEAISFLVGGGHDVRVVGVRLLVGGKPVREAAGRDDEALRRVFWDVRKLAGAEAILEIRDDSDGGWGHILADDFRLEALYPGD